MALHIPAVHHHAGNTLCRQPSDLLTGLIDGSSCAIAGVAARDVGNAPVALKVGAMPSPLLHMLSVLQSHGLTIGSPSRAAGAGRYAGIILVH